MTPPDGEWHDSSLEVLRLKGLWLLPSEVLRERNEVVIDSLALDVGALNDILKVVIIDLWSIIDPVRISDVPLYLLCFGVPHAHP